MLRRAAHLSEKRSGTLNLRDDDRSLVPPGDTGSPRSGGPARASPTQSRTAAPPVGDRTPQLAAYREKFRGRRHWRVLAVRPQPFAHLPMFRKRSAQRGDHSDKTSQIGTAQSLVIESVICHSRHTRDV